jgi:hypothetical protein
MKITQVRHPDYDACCSYWAKWRLCYAGGDNFIETYLKRMSTRESDTEFNARKEISYCPAFAKATLNDVKNSIFQRFSEIKRAGGSKAYQDAVKGIGIGVDRQGHAMNTFIGTKLLETLLVCGKVGIYVDMLPVAPGATLAQTQGMSPYMYLFMPEDILSWTYDSDNLHEFQSVLLREVKYIESPYGLPSGETVQYRLLYKKAGKVQVEFYRDEDEATAAQTGETKQLPFKSEVLNLPTIPFVVLELTDSLLTDVANYQIALLNIASSDVAYLTKANFPFYVEKTEGGAKTTPDIGTTKEVKVGPTQGRRVPKGTEMPQFIHPSSEPITASMKKQESMISEIRILINLSLSNIKAKMASAESKQVDSQGLEAGLAYIGLELQFGESQIAKFWAMYEGSKNVATIHYPEKWTIESEAQKNERIKQIQEMITKVPSLHYKRELAKELATLVIGTKVSREKLASIHAEIDEAEVFVTDIAELQMAIDAGMADPETASEMSGLFPKGTAKKAEVSHADRLARIAEAQAKKVSASNQSGVADQAGAGQDKSIASQTATPQRGEGK